MRLRDNLSETLHILGVYLCLNTRKGGIYFLACLISPKQQN